VCHLSAHAFREDFFVMLLHSEGCGFELVLLSFQSVDCRGKLLFEWRVMVKRDSYSTVILFAVPLIQKIVHFSISPFVFATNSVDSYP
jgi:hypothetical protein